MAEIIPNHEELMEQARIEGRLHYLGPIGDWPKTHEEALKRLLEFRMRRNGWRPGKEMGDVN